LGRVLTAFKDPVFRQGFRHGLRSILTGRCELPHHVVRREVGSQASDRIARHRDIEAFAADVSLGDKYRAASDEWAPSDEAELWDATAGDGLDDSSV